MLFTTNKRLCLFIKDILMSIPINEPKKHHYIPAFFLRNWESKSEKKLVEFRSIHQKLLPKEVSAEGTGYKDLLYSHTSDEAGNLNHSFEKDYLSSLDNDAAVALRIIISEDPSFDQDVKTDWSRLVMSLMTRTPEDIDSFKKSTEYMNENPSPFRKFIIEKLSAELKISPEECYEIVANLPQHEIGEVVFKSLGSLIEWSQMIPILTSMKWCVRDIHNSNYNFLISDRPIITNNKLAMPSGFLTMPVTPKRLLIMHHGSSDVANLFINSSDNEVVRYCNRAVVQAARQYVWSTTRAQEGYVRKWLGKQKQYSVNEIAELAIQETNEPLSTTTFSKTAKKYGALVFE